MVGNQRWCDLHKRVYQALQKHAKDKGAVEVGNLNKIMQDPVTAKDYMEEHMRNNPGGKYARMNIIDWSQWLRKYVEARELKNREAEREFDIKILDEVRS